THLGEDVTQSKNFLGDNVAAQPETPTVPLTEKAQIANSIAGVFTIIGLSSACSSEFVLASWTCKSSDSTGQAGAGSTHDNMRFDATWSTDFENGFCDYSVGNGSCYSTGSASYQIVESPVHGGKYAAAFSVIADGTGTNSRCHRDGELPAQATYGAWYYIPALATNSDNWNLLHFQGGSSPDVRLGNLWDVSLDNDDTGGLRLSVFDSISNSSMTLSNTPAIPIGSWFHIEVFLKRASDATGEISVYQDGITVLHATELITDNTTYGQWYVGNLATKLTPTMSTVYVDDVTIKPSR
ncbi:MAG TPA: heparin lyase I family protein, partial [Polyangiaceae bacterium]